ncbi:uncharacterized protein Z519_04983 [Cladophialophora bantiana CBS 173.52]|uniref:beta-glucosidase n=1 Tax=Cladophialophora bantiana (strain ATCC 10958 / CBS 173.52 / CDC B-1940 / NIH 8579) TaxID=1442370 RepID=A0A0D2HNQ8_CLAB1|nr:uncharacterized protein Z519_04983 [Cladophialophora bantiana CBS 173.52]KIW95003.1 hypothetical protein Z519_04983 [Cladophialophora bantiana CBS 173.52]
MASGGELDVEWVLSQLGLEEKVGLLSGVGRCKTAGIERLNVPSINPRTCMLPCGTALGATFDSGLLRGVGELLGDEARGKNIQVVLGPVSCLQRSPLIGRGFEAFGEDPWLSGALAAAYIDGVQSRKVAACLKHYAAHDQSWNSIEDNCVMTERTLREMHTLPFQIAVRQANPWSIMSSYNKINGTHVSEHKHLLDEILRDDLKWDGIVISDWWGTYSTTGSIEAGMDLEMPGPSLWRGKLLTWAVEAGKVPRATIDRRVRAVLNFIRKVQRPPPTDIKPYNDTPASRAFIRQVAAQSVVLLKNNDNRLPLSKSAPRTYGLIGYHFQNPAVCGGGSSEVDAYYLNTPYDAFVEAVGENAVEYQLGCYSHRFTPLIASGHTVPGSSEPGFLVQFYGENPHDKPDARCLYATVSLKSSMPFNDSIPLFLPNVLFVSAKATYAPPNSGRFRFGLSISGKARLFVNGRESIDLWSEVPEKTAATPMLNSFTMEKCVDLDLNKGESIELEVLLTNEGIHSFVVGAAPAPGLRLGAYEVLDEDKTIANAVALARRVDVPVVLAGLSSDHEFENFDRRHLRLPGRQDELIKKVLDANPNTIVVTQSGLPIGMPWLSKANSLLHAWFGGQETGHGITDVVFGDVNPSARLSVTFPKRVEDTPTYLMYGKSDKNILYGEGVFIGHRYYEQVDREPLFYFGYGLSYSRFEYSNLQVPSEFEAREDHVMRLSVRVSNVGTVDGSEIVQVYVGDADCTVLRPKKELKAFAKANIASGQSKEIKVELDKYAVSYWSEVHGKWMAEAGVFTVIISRSADPLDHVLSADFTLPQTFLWAGQ